MSTQEPVSAYGVFKAAKDINDKKKKSKKNKKRSSKAKYSYQDAHGKPSCASTSKDSDDINKMKIFDTSKENVVKINRVKAKNINSNKLHKNRKAADKNLSRNRFDAQEILNLKDQIYTDGSKNLSKEEQQKKKVEDYLIKQLEVNDDDLESQDYKSFDSQGSQEEYHYSNSDKNISKNYSFQKTETGGIESSASEDNNQNVQSLSQAQMVNSNKKRKKSNVATTKTKSNTNTSSVMPVAKKYKKNENHLPSARKSSFVDKNTEDFQQTPKDGLSLATYSTESAYNKVEKLNNVKLEPLMPPTNVVQLNSIEEGKRAFQWLLNPLPVDDFFDKYWEQKACLIKRQQSSFFSHLISFKAIDQMLLKNHVEFTKNIDITSYKNGVRETLNPDGRALPPTVWDYYGQGCSIRLINPQTFMSAIYTLSTTMQEYFHCLVGANAYLTPPNSQGFAPHYDDIEAFVLQIEGRKRWKLYKPRKTSEILPRNSSGNFSQEDIDKPFMETVLEPGDLLYFPRGTIHQACTEIGYHSLHITLSVYQKQSFADLFEKMLPILLEKAITSNVELRRGLPLYAWQHAGLAFNTNSTKERDDLTTKVTQLMHKCIRDMPLQDIMDAGMDQLAKKFQHEALPPEILPSEKLRTVFGSRSNTNERGECVCDYDIDERTNVRLLKANILRLLEEEGKIRIYYYLDNSKEYCEYEANFIEIDATEAASVEVLIKSYPQYVGVSQLPLSTDEDKISLATALWERGLLMMEKPFR